MDEHPALSLTLFFATSILVGGVLLGVEVTMQYIVQPLRGLAASGVMAFALLTLMVAPTGNRE